MPRFAANLSTLFAELPFMERFGAAAAAGFRDVEFQFPYAHDANDIAEAIERHDLSVVLHNMPPGDWDAGERGIAILPHRKDEFRESVETALVYATRLGARRVNCLAGRAPAKADPADLESTFIANLSFAATAFEKAGIGLVIEAINTRDMPGFFLSTSEHARRIIQTVGADNLRFQYDVYHMQIMEGDLAPTLERMMPMIGHIQIADTPGRHEPGTGEINFSFLFDHLDRVGYDGWIGCEYTPQGDTKTSLDWLAPYL